MDRLEWLVHLAPELGLLAQRQAGGDGDQGEREVGEQAGQARHREAPGIGRPGQDINAIWCRPIANTRSFFGSDLFIC